MTFKTIISFLISISLIVAPAVHAQSSTFETDFDPPLIEHTPETREVTGGSSQTISATVTDNQQVGAVFLHYRKMGESSYTKLPMNRTRATNHYYSTLEGTIATSPGIEYYIESSDLSGNTVLKGYAITPLLLKIGEPPAAPTIAAEQPAEEPLAKIEESSSSSKWLWIGLGVVAVGALAASGGGSDGGGSDTVPLSITATPP